MSLNSNKNLLLGCVLFDPFSQRLSDSQGRDIALRPQSLAVLKLLADHPNELVLREELVTAVWGGISVTDDSLIQCIADIRKAIGDGNHKIIQTVPKKGYRLLPSPPPNTLPTFKSNRLLISMVFMAALFIAGASLWLSTRHDLASGPVSLAVLPFKNVSGNSDQTYFAEAMTRAITTNVSKFEGLFVVSDHSAFQFRDTEKPVEQIARELNVRYLFSGEVFPGPDQVTVNAQLIDSQSGQVVWAEQFKVPREDVFLVQEDLSAKLATSLVSQVEIAAERLSWQQDRTNLNAYELLLQADLPKIERQSLNEGIALLQYAVELDPKFARGHALIGFYYMLMWRHSLAENLGLALSEARRWTALALSISDLSYEAHETLGIIQLYADEDHESAFASLSRALLINPNHADTMVQMATLLTFMGRYEEANEWIDRAYQQNPLYPTWYHWNASFVYAVTGQHERANVTAKKALVVYESSQSLRRILIYAQGMLGDWDSAQRYAREILGYSPDFRLSTHMRNSPFQNPETKRQIFSVFEQAGLPP